MTRRLANAQRRILPGEPLTPAPPLGGLKSIHSAQNCAAEPTLSRGERVTRVAVPAGACPVTRLR
jgi:hypothetical protein